MLHYSKVAECSNCGRVKVRIKLGLGHKSMTCPKCKSVFNFKPAAKNKND